ncbi:SH3 domain-containing protein [Altererythrobacter endophyticus]|uniref:SH3 domain-containing protein n=2 Tax=Altericroceibacterium endophyticum TaxID=1808508 RepID=A0A6I4T9D1_9SPHN|nr:SH3 domain-containing protein [Altericroceibacterium endophyticum]
MFIALPAAAALIATAPMPAMAKDSGAAPQLTHCDQSIGTIAVVEGDAAGWTEWNLSSPRELIYALARESGCFTPHNPSASTPARFLVTAIAGSQEDVDQGVEIGKSVATEALIRSGAAGKVLSSVPFAGAALGMFGGLGGKKKTVAAGLKVVDPASGMAVAGGTGSVKKSTIKFKNDENEWARSAAGTAGYADSKKGQMLTEAFVLAFNNLIAQRSALEVSPVAQGGAAAGTVAPASSAAVVAIDTVMRAEPSVDGAAKRSLRAGTELTPTGNREGLFIEATDNYGTTGWVSVEDLG